MFQLLSALLFNDGAFAAPVSLYHNVASPQSGICNPRSGNCAQPVRHPRARPLQLRVSIQSFLLSQTPEALETLCAGLFR